MLIHRYRQDEYAIDCDGVSILCIKTGSVRSLQLQCEVPLDLTLPKLSKLIEALWRARQWVAVGTPPNEADPPTVLGLRKAIAHLEQNLVEPVNKRVVISRLQAMVNESLSKTKIRIGGP